MERIKCDSTIPTIEELGAFLVRYSARLLGSGATCIRIEKNISRIAQSYGREADITIMPRHIHLSVKDENTPCGLTVSAPVEHIPISFNVNTLLSQLSWEIYDKKISFNRALSRFESIKRCDIQNSLLVLVLVSLANASFCRLFGGDLTAMAIVGIATFAGYFLKMMMLKRKIDVRVVVMTCAFVSSVLGASGLLFGISSTPQIALATSVLYLVPGIPFLNSFSDLLYRHYVCAFSRFTDAMVLTACLSIGLCGGMALMKAGMF